MGWELRGSDIQVLRDRFESKLDPRGGSCWEGIPNAYIIPVIALNVGKSTNRSSGQGGARHTASLPLKEVQHRGCTMVKAKFDPLLGEAPSSNARFDELILDQNGYYKFKTNKKYVHRTNYYKKHPETPKHWHVHHINGRKTDNSLRNLIGLPPEIHKELHKIWRMWELPNRGQILKWWSNKKRLTSKKTNREDLDRRHVRRVRKTSATARGTTMVIWTKRGKRVVNIHTSRKGKNVYKS